MDRFASDAPAPHFEALYAQIARLPEGVTGEILRPGVLVTMARPGPSHRFTAKRLDEDLRDRDATRGGHGW